MDGLCVRRVQGQVSAAQVGGTNHGGDAAYCAANAVDCHAAAGSHCTRYVEAYMRQQPPFVDEFLTVTIPHTQVASLWWLRGGDNGCLRR